MEIRLNWDELRKYKLFFGAPCYGSLTNSNFAQSMANLTTLCTQHNIYLQMYLLNNESLITRARNYIADAFLRSECTHMIFVDADIGFNPMDVIALLALQISKPSEYDIIGAAYPKKTISWEKIKTAVDKGLADKNPADLARFVGDFVLNPLPGKDKINLFEPSQVLEIGTGFMLFPRETLNKFKEAFPHYTYRPDHVRSAEFDGSREIHQFFQAEIDTIDYGHEYRNGLNKIKEMQLNSAGEVSIEIDRLFKETEEKASKRTKRYLSEDYWFAQKCGEIGLKTWVCPWMKLSHTGAYVFEGSVAELAQAGVVATASIDEVAKMKTK